MITDLHRKYRPNSFDKVLGQDATISSIRHLFDINKVPHSFLFISGSGVGKTTISRIIAQNLDAELVEIDAATHTGIDDMKEIADTVSTKSWLGAGKYFVIIDECHQLSKSSWNSWLKLVEEPPEHLYFSFCTTEPDKVPETIKTRCHVYTLKYIDDESLYALAEYVCEEEHIDLPKNSIHIIIKESNGSARRLLNLISQIRGCKTIEELKDMLGSAVDKVEVIDLCRLIVNERTSARDLLRALKVLKNTNPESIRIQICNYLNACILSGKDTRYFLNLLANFTHPYTQQTGFSELVVDIFASKGL